MGVVVGTNCQRTPPPWSPTTAPAPCGSKARTETRLRRPTLASNSGTRGAVDKTLKPRLW